MLTTRINLAILGVVTLAYILLVPIMPFQYYYSVDPSNSGTIDAVCNKNLLFFDLLSRPSSVPLSGANFGVWGVQSVSASVANFGIVSNGICDFNPTTSNISGLPIIWFFSLTLTAILAVGLALLFLRNNQRSPQRKSD